MARVALHASFCSSSKAAKCFIPVLPCSNWNLKCHKPQGCQGIMQGVVMVSDRSYFLSGTLGNPVPEVEIFAAMFLPPAEVNRCFSAFIVNFLAVCPLHIPIRDAKSSITSVQDTGVWKCDAPCTTQVMAIAHRSVAVIPCVVASAAIWLDRPSRCRNCASAVSRASLAGSRKLPLQNFVCDALESLFKSVHIQKKFSINFRKDWLATTQDSCD